MKKLEPAELADVWQLVGRTKNPWGQIPHTVGGASLPEGAQRYVARLKSQIKAPDSVSRKHHYVPQSYLREWSTDGKRVLTWDTSNGKVKLLGIKNICVRENFYRVVGAEGEAHNRVELMFGVVDTETRRVQKLFIGLGDPEQLEFDDLVGLCVSVAVQRMRTVQERRLQLQYDAWLVAQQPEKFTSIRNDSANPLRESGILTRLLFESMWEAADVLTTRQIEIWNDERGRFLTSDAPVIVPFHRNVRAGLEVCPYIIWPISPWRAVALTLDHVGQKAVIKKANGQMVGLVQRGVEQGRERMIIGAESQRERMSAGKVVKRRPQSRIRCSSTTPFGDRIPPPGCCIEWTVAFASRPDLVLCDQGLHQPPYDMEALI